MQWESLVEKLMTQGAKKRMSIEDIVDNLPVLPAKRRKAKFLNFIYEATGVSKSNLLLDEDLRNFQQSKDKNLQSIQAAVFGRADPKTYPISNKGFFERFSQFVYAFVMKSGESLFAPENGPEDITDFLQILLLIEYKPHRHTATLACLKIITAGAHVGLKIMKDIESVESENCTEEDSRDLSSTLNSLQVDLLNVKSVLRALCEGVSQRYRDAFADIRELCLKEAELWCKGLLPLVGVKVFGKTLANRLVDTVKSVRHQALQVALTLFGHRDNQQMAINEDVSKLFNVIGDQLFYNTLSNVEKDAVVAVEALVEALKYFHDIVIKPNVVNCLLLHIYSEHLGLGCEGGAVLKVVIEMRTEHPIERLRELLKFSAERVGGETCVFYGLEYARCEWFFDSVHLLHLLRALLQDTDKPLSINERRSLIVLLGCLVRKLATGQTPPRQRVPKAEALKNWQPLPRADERLKPLPPVVLEDFPYILILCSQQDIESCTYLVRLLQFMSYEEASLEQEVLSTWLRKAFDESDDFDLLEEISRALATLVQQGTVAPFQTVIDEICETSVDKAMNVLGVVYSQGLIENEKLVELLCLLMKVSALLPHGHLNNLSGHVYIADICDVLKALARNESATTPVKVEVMKTSFQILHRFLVQDYRLIPCDYWESITLSPECLELQKNANSLFTLGNYLILRKEAAVRLGIYPIVCDLFVDMVRMDFSDKTAKLFVAASKRVLEMDVFRVDEEGNFPQELLEPGLKILCKFSRVVRSGVISIAELPPVFHYYTKYCDRYDEELKNLLSAKKSCDNEPEILVSILRSVQAVYSEEGITSSQEVARKLALLFGEPMRRETLRVFHETLLMICLSLNPSGWSDDTTAFAYHTSTHFGAFMRDLSSEQLFEYLDQKIPDLQTVSSNTDVKEYVENYLQLIGTTRSCLTGNTSRRSNANTSQRVPQRRRQANLTGNRKRQRGSTQKVDSGRGSQEPSTSRRTNVGSRRNQSRSGNRRSVGDGTGRDSQEPGPSRRLNVDSGRNQSRSGNRRSVGDGTGSDTQELSRTYRSNFGLGRNLSRSGIREFPVRGLQGRRLSRRSNVSSRKNTGNRRLSNYGTRMD